MDFLIADTFTDSLARLTGDEQKAIERGYVVTKALDDFGPVGDLPESGARVLRIPAPLLCYWMGESEPA